MGTSILGIDPGLQHTGWGIVWVEGSRLAHVANGTIHTNAADPLEQRLRDLHLGVQNAMVGHTITSAAMEQTFVNKNAVSSLKLSHARGALMATISLAGLSVTEYAPTTVKKAVVGLGRAEKQQVQMMLKCLLPGVVIDSEDSADALAVAICHAHHGTWR